MKIQIIIIIFLLLNCNIYAQRSDIKIKNFEPLHQNLHDKQKIFVDTANNQLWVSTHTQLFCLDDNKIIKEINNNDFSLRVNSFHLKKDTLWCSSEGSIFSIVLNSKEINTYQKLVYKSEDDGIIISLSSNQKYLYAGTTKGTIFRYDTKSNEVENISIPYSVVSESNIYDILFANTGNKYQPLIAIPSGLFYFKNKWLPINRPYPKLKIHDTFDEDLRPSIDLDLPLVYKIKLKDNQVWGIGKEKLNETETTSVLFRLDNLYSEDFFYTKSKQSCLKENGKLFFYDFQLDTKGNVWIATENGLVIYDMTNKECYHITSETDSLFKIKSIENIFLENDTTAYLFGVADPKKGNEIFKMQIGELPILAAEDTTKTVVETPIDTNKTAVKILEKIEDIDCNKVLKLSNLIFGSSQDNFVNFSKAKKDLDLLAQYLKQDLGRTVEIEAHTSVVRNETKEKEISNGRLQRVRDYLLENGVSKKQIATIAKGDSELLIKKPQNANEHQQNRRVIAKIICETNQNNE